MITHGLGSPGGGITGGLGGGTGDGVGQASAPSAPATSPGVNSSFGRGRKVKSAWLKIKPEPPEPLSVEEEQLLRGFLRGAGQVRGQFRRAARRAITGTAKIRQAKPKAKPPAWFAANYKPPTLSAAPKTNRGFWIGLGLGLLVAYWLAAD